jgi:hypothetical protein
MRVMKWTSQLLPEGSRTHPTDHGFVVLDDHGFGPALFKAVLILFEFVPGNREPGNSRGKDL